MTLHLVTNDSGYKLEAERASMTCFLNSLLREWSDWELLPLPILLNTAPEPRSGVRIALSASEAFWIPVARHSSLGRHEYSWPVYRESSPGRFEIVDFTDLTDGIIQSLKMNDSADSKSRFRSRVQDSLLAVAEVLSHRAIDSLMISPPSSKSPQ